MSVTGTLGRSDAWLEIKIHKWQLTNGMFCYIIIIIIILRRGDQFDHDLQSLWISKFWRGVHMSLTSIWLS